MTTNAAAHPADQPSLATPAVTPAVVLFGLDAQGKAHASRFTSAEAALAEKAAGLMGLHVLHVDDDEGQRALVASLPAGRIFASGRGFVPFVARTLFDRLCALGGVPLTAQPPVATVAGDPAEAAAGSRRPGPTPLTAPILPRDWGAIEVGALVLATTGPAEGWFEAHVREDKGDDLFALRWRDWEGEPPFLRRRNQLALLPPDLAGTD